MTIGHATQALRSKRSENATTHHKLDFAVKSISQNRKKNLERVVQAPLLTSG